MVESKVKEERSPEAIFWQRFPLQSSFSDLQ
jgi:hypothetical protein